MDKITTSLQCENCRFYYRLIYGIDERSYKFMMSNNINIVKNYCEAFPDGIPHKIYWGEVDHSTPYPNKKNPKDNGLTFEPRRGYL